MRVKIQVTGVPTSLHEELKDIAKDHGVTLSGYLKPILRRLAEEYYEKYPDRRGKHK